MALQIALLRGINLGSRNRIKMPDLRALCENLGHDEVETHLQSGNIVLRSSDPVKKTGEALSRAIEKEFGFAVPVVMRTPAQMKKVRDGNPFPDGIKEPKFLNVRFCEKAPPRSAQGKFDPGDFEPERFEFRGKELYSWHPDGIQGSKLARKLDDEVLGVVTTNRNWNTVEALVEMTG